MFGSDKEHVKIVQPIDNLVWLSNKTVQEMIRNFDDKTQTSKISDLYDKWLIKFSDKDAFSKEEFSEFIVNYPYISYDEIDYKNHIVTLEEY